MSKESFAESTSATKLDGYEAVQITSVLGDVFTPPVVRQADRDGNGLLNAKELGHVAEVPTIAPFMKPALQALSNRADEVAALSTNLTWNNGATPRDLDKLKGKGESLMFLDRMTPEKFKSIDKDASGSISRDELDQFRYTSKELGDRSLASYMINNYKSIGTSKGITEAHVESHRAGLLKDPAVRLLNNIVGDLKEGVEVTRPMMPAGTFVDTVEKAFGRLDLDNDGAISKYEAEKADANSFEGDEQTRKQASDILWKHFPVLAAMNDGNDMLNREDLTRLKAVAYDRAEPYFKDSWMSYRSQRDQFNKMAQDVADLRTMDPKLKEPAGKDSGVHPDERKPYMTPEEENRMWRTLFVLEVLWQIGTGGPKTPPPRRK